MQNVALKLYEMGPTRSARCLWMLRWASTLTVAAVLAPGCPGDEPPTGVDVSVGDILDDVDVGVDSSAADVGPSPEDVSADLPVTPLEFVVVTINVGTTTFLSHDVGDDGYTQEMADIASEQYANNLSWRPAEEAMVAFLAELQPHIVAFQELYYDPWCDNTPVDPELDFVCKDYTPGGPLQIERLLGADYRIACAAGHVDNCVGVRRDFGSLRGCPGDGVCLDGLKGTPAGDCSKGARVGRVEVDLPDGRSLVVVDVHANAGFDERDMQCRVQQFGQVFVDAGDGQPAASGEANLVMGDMNTDPFLLMDTDPSAVFWSEHVGEGRRFQYISASDLEGPPSQVGLFHLDHVVSDVVTGSCVVAGVSEGVPAVMDALYWDHSPVVCDVTF